MPTRYIAITPESGVNPSDLARVSAAMQKQVTRDLGPTWHVSGTIDPFPSLEDVPAGYWPIILTFRPLGTDAGIHIDSNGQPYALIEMSPSWSLTASHVAIEMITDPFGSRSIPGVSPRDRQGDVEFRGGVCDPCEHPDSAYLVNDVLVSDFCTPAFWEPSSTGRRSFTGAIREPYQILPGGHLCWYDPASNTWWLRRLSDGVLTDIEVGMIDPEHGTVREFLCRHSLHLQSTKLSLEAFEARVGSTRQRANRASQSRAYWLRSSLQKARTRPLELEAQVREEHSAALPPREPSQRPQNPAQALSALRAPSSVPPPLPSDHDGAEGGENAQFEGEYDAVTIDKAAGPRPRSTAECASESDLVTTVYEAASERESSAPVASVDPPAPPASRSAGGRTPTVLPPRPRPSAATRTPAPPRTSVRSDPAREEALRRSGTTIRPAHSSLPPPPPRAGAGPVVWGVLVGILAASLAGTSALLVHRDVRGSEAKPAAAAFGRLDQALGAAAAGVQASAPSAPAQNLAVPEGSPVTSVQRAARPANSATGPSNGAEPWKLAKARLAWASNLPGVRPTPGRGAVSTQPASAASASSVGFATARTGEPSSAKSAGADAESSVDEFGGRN